MATNALWRPEDVVARAKDLIHASNYERVAEARKAVDDTLAQWVAHVLAQRQQSGAASAEPSAALVAQLWGAYAALEVELRQFKQATKVFERAVSCPVAGGSAALWLQYAAFCVERRKFSNARKIFVRALHAVTATPDRDALWAAFHAFVVAHVEPTMSLDTLKAQVPVPPVSVGAGTGAAAPAPSAAASAAADAPAAAPAALAPAPPSVLSSSPQAVLQQPATATVPPPLQQLQPPQQEQQEVTTVVSAPAAVNGTAQPPPGGAVANTVHSEEPALALDPALAFVDKTGQTEPATLSRSDDSATSSKKRGPDALQQLGEDPSKRAKQEGSSALDAPSLAPAKLEISDTLYFRHIPTTLPLIAACPHLLFDAVHESEGQSEIGEELLERLSDVLRDTAVFQGVNDLCASQRQRDRETLYRWQDLVGVQMKEGSELFARHMDVELKHAADPRELIALKTQHLEQRREFITRCQMSQQQFIEITGLDRVNALKAQQISLENMKIPEMTVTTDPKVIGLQRAVLVLVQETEKLYREEMKKLSDAAGVAASPAKSSIPTKKSSPELTGSAGPSAHGSRGTATYYPKQQPQPQDSSYSQSNRSGFRSGRGAYGSRGSTDRQNNARASAGYGSRGAPPRRDYDSSYAQPGAASRAGYDNLGPSRQQPLHVRPTGYQGQQHQQRASSSFSDRIVAHAQDYGSSDYPQESSRGRYADPPSYGSDGGDPAWEQQPPPRYSQPRGSDYSHGGSRYGGGGGSTGGGGQLPPPASSLTGAAALVSSYSNGPKQSRGRTYGAGDAGMASPQQQYGEYSAFSSGPQHHQQRGGAGYQQQQSPPYSGYQSDDYAAPLQSNFSSYSNRNPAPYQQQQQQQQHQAPPPQQQQQYHQFQQRGGRVGGGGGGYGHQQQQQQQPLHSHLGQQQAQGYSRGGTGGGGFRRGGGGGGARFGRR